jgi:TonB family protein
MKINYWEDAPSKPQVINLLTIVANGDRFVEESNKFTWDWDKAALLITVFISTIFLTQLIITIAKIKALVSNNPTKKWNDIFFVFTNAKGTPFSFFKYIFWNEQIDLNSAEGEQILKHELAHVRENHSADKFCLSIILILGWCNPFFWLIRKEMNMIHEFIADQKAINNGDVHSFAAMLLKTAYPDYSFPLANSFFYSPVKRRLLMLTTSKETSFTYLRKIAVLPLLMFTCLLFAFTLKKQKISFRSDETAESTTAANKQAQNLKRSSENLIDANLRDTTKKKNRETKVMDVTFKDSTGNKSTTSTSVTYTSKDTGKLMRPLVVLDGKEMTWEEFNKRDIKSEKIQSINVLKDKSTTSKYGDKGKDGVIEITLKAQNSDQKNNYQDDQKNFEAQQKNFEAEQKQQKKLEAQFEAQQKKFETEQKELEANFEKERNKQEQQRKSSTVFTQVENPPYYPNGMSAFAGYINSNMRYPKEAIQKRVEGAVLIQFIVNEEGKLTDFKKLSDKGYGLEEEAIRLLKNSGDWKPGVQNGRKVRVQVQQQVIFELPKTQ